MLGLTDYFRAVNQLQEMVEDFEAPQLFYDNLSVDERYGVMISDWREYWAPSLVEAVDKAYIAWKEE